MSIPISSALYEKIKHVSKIDRFLDKNKKFMVKHSLWEQLDLLLMKKYITISEVVRGSQLYRSYVYQIFSGVKKL